MLARARKTGLKRRSVRDGKDFTFKDAHRERGGEGRGEERRGEERKRASE